MVLTSGMTAKRRSACSCRVGEGGLCASRSVSYQTYCSMWGRANSVISVILDDVLAALDSHVAKHVFGGLTLVYRFTHRSSIIQRMSSGQTVCWLPRPESS